MRLLEKSLKLIAPHECILCGNEDSVLCESCADKHLQVFGERCAGCNALSVGSKTCPSCRHGGLPAHVWISVVYTGVASRLVYKYKFDHQRECSVVMASLITEGLKNNVFGTSGNVQIDNFLVVPVPTATRRVRERGFDHSKLLAKQVVAKLNLQYVDVIGRVGQKAQVGASRHTRMAQSQNEYYLKNSKPITGKKILLIDDVVTTGATLKACAGLLRQGGAISVNAAVFAKKI